MFRETPVEMHSCSPAPRILPEKRSAEKEGLSAMESLSQPLAFSSARSVVPVYLEQQPAKGCTVTVSGATGQVFLDLTNWRVTFMLNTVNPPYLCGLKQPCVKILEKNCRKFQKANLNLLHTSNYIYSFYIVLGTITNPEMI